uniref:Uncharacterized protein n=1 Tax=Lympha mucosa TaxID=2045360 RepID=A0A6B9VT20_9FLOR|nr:hypothetical protein [Lympha mucosa]
MNISKTFIKVWNINIDGKSKIQYYNTILPVIPAQWQFLLISDGSFTKNLSIFKKYTVLLKLIKQEKIFYPIKKVYSKQNIRDKNNFAYSREIWLMDKKKLFDICKIVPQKRNF